MSSQKLGMPAAYRDAQTFFAALFGMAEELREKLIPLSDVERMRLVTEVVRESDLVFGVWPEEGESFGVQIIKGEAILPPVEGFERNDELRVAAIPCVGLEQALAARDEWGDLFEACEEEHAAQSALALAEVARLIWIASRNGS